MFDTEGRELKQLTGFSKGFDVGAFQRGKYIVILDFDFLYGTCQFVPLFDLAGATVFDPSETVSFLGPFLSVTGLWTRNLVLVLCPQQFQISSLSPGSSSPVFTRSWLHPTTQKIEQNSTDRFSNHCYQPQYCRKYLGMFMMECVFVNSITHTPPNTYIHL